MRPTLSVASDPVKSSDLSLTAAATPPYKGKIHEEKRCFTALDENDFLERRDDYLTPTKDELELDIMSKLAYGIHFDHTTKMPKQKQQTERKANCTK